MKYKMRVVYVRKACAVVSPSVVRALSRPVSVCLSSVQFNVLIMPFALPFRLIRYKLKFDGEYVCGATIVACRRCGRYPRPPLWIIASKG